MSRSRRRVSTSPPGCGYRPTRWPNSRTKSEFPQTISSPRCIASTNSHSATTTRTSVGAGNRSTGHSPAAGRRWCRSTPRPTALRRSGYPISVQGWSAHRRRRACAGHPRPADRRSVCGRQHHGRGVGYDVPGWREPDRRLAVVQPPGGDAHGALRRAIAVDCAVLETMWPRSLQIRTVLASLSVPRRAHDLARTSTSCVVLATRCPSMSWIAPRTRPR